MGRIFSSLALGMSEHGWQHLDLKERWIEHQRDEKHFAENVNSTGVCI